MLSNTWCVCMAVLNNAKVIFWLSTAIIVCIKLWMSHRVSVIWTYIHSSRLVISYFVLWFNCIVINNYTFFHSLTTDYEVTSIMMNENMVATRKEIYS